MKIRSNIHIDSNENLRINRRKRKKNTNKKLLFLFFSTFVFVLLIFTYTASLFSPKINIPALDNENATDSVTSNDFKARVDSRLKLIELRDRNKEDETGNVAVQQNNSDNAVTAANSDKSIGEPEKSDFISEQNYKFKKMMNDPNNSVSEEIQPNDQQEEQPLDTFENNNQKQVVSTNPAKQVVVPPAAVNTAKPALKQLAGVQSNQPPKLVLRKKVEEKAKQPQLVKVIVGNYSDPMAAKRASDEITSTNGNLTPFIKESKGSYTLQVGSFSNPQKAQELVDTLKGQNHNAKMVQD